MAQTISEYTKDTPNGLNSVSIFKQDNFEHAGVNLTTHLILVFCFENCSENLQRAFSVARTICSHSERSGQFLKQNKELIQWNNSNANWKK